MKETKETTKNETGSDAAITQTGSGFVNGSMKQLSGRRPTLKDAVRNWIPA